MRENHGGLQAVENEDEACSDGGVVSENSCSGGQCLGFASVPMEGHLLCLLSGGG